MRFFAVVLFTLVAGVFAAPIAIPEENTLVVREASPEPEPQACGGTGVMCF